MNTWRLAKSNDQNDGEWQYALIASNDEYCNAIQSESCHSAEYSSVASDESIDGYDDQSIASSLDQSIPSDDGYDNDDGVETDYDPTTKSLFERAISYFYDKKGTNVTFARHDRIRDIPNRHSLDESNIWYGREELKQIRQEKRRLVDLMDKGVLTDDDDMCYGLETGEDSVLRERISVESVRNVCVEQEKLWESEKGLDEEALSEVYFETSFASHLEAHQRALQLEKDVQDYVVPGRWAPGSSFSPHNSRSELELPPQPRFGEEDAELKFNSSCPSFPRLGDSLSSLGDTSISSVPCSPSQPPRRPIRRYSTAATNKVNFRPPVIRI